VVQEKGQRQDAKNQSRSCKVKPIDRKKWRREWDETEVKQLEQIAEEMINRGAINEEAAWLAAEERMPWRSSPYLRRRR
jgi:hypothetical protein